ncbi:unnamed protein product [Ascophyllum nodosum]
MRQKTAFRIDATLVRSTGMLIYSIVLSQIECARLRNVTSETSRGVRKFTFKRSKLAIITQNERKTPNRRAIVAPHHTFHAIHL